MPEKRFAASHPGKLGDALYTLPTIRKIYQETGLRCDFYTSIYCAPARNLMLYQDCIADFIIPETYRVERMDLGCQPWYMPIDESKYEFVYQLGFRTIPDRTLPQFIALYAGIEELLPILYTYPEGLYLDQTDYICIAPRGDTSFGSFFDEVAIKTNAVIIGGAGEYRGVGIDCTGQDMLLTTAILARSHGFVGLMSSQLVLANGFDVPKIAVHDGIHWDMRHVVYSPSNYYLINPTVDECIRILKK